MKDSMDRIRKAIEDEKTAVVSFDIFDTLLLRPFWEPTDLFKYLDKEICGLLGTTDIVNFSVCRKTYEVEARDQAIAKGREDLTLSEIYDYIKTNSSYPPNVIQILMEKEKDLELRFCTARESIGRFIEIAKKSNKRLIAISDMYLPADFIRSILEKNGITQIEQIFVSGDLGLTKGTGHLYEHVAKAMKIEYHSIVHIGDNYTTDVRIPGKMGIRAFHYPRTVSLMAKGKTGAAYRHSYEQIRSVISNYHATDELGIRCMLAVAANRIFDDPFRIKRQRGDYARDAMMFGNLALGMYCMAQGLWIYQHTRAREYNKVLFFSRDGYLPWLAYNMIQGHARNSGPEATYVRCSRKALLPLLLTNEIGPLEVGAHVMYYDHSPCSLTLLMNPVLKEEAEEQLKGQYGAQWQRVFKSENDMVNHMMRLHREYVDDDKARCVQQGYRAYFEPLMKGRVLTYDIGYSLRNEITLRRFFPEVSIDACFTHSVSDVPLQRAAQGNIGIFTFYSSTPFVSWLPRELFLTENAPSCVGYTPEGQPVMNNKYEENDLIAEMQRHAIAYMQDFIAIFGEDVEWLPMQVTNACLPMETFLHSPRRADRHWIRGINADNAAASGLKLFQCYDFWRRLRVDYWAASHGLGRCGRYMVLFVLLLFSDRQDLATAIHKRLPHRIKRLLEK